MYLISFNKSSAEPLATKMRLSFRFRWAPQKHDLDFSKPYRDTGEPIIDVPLRIPNALIYTGARM